MLTPERLRSCAFGQCCGPPARPWVDRSRLLLVFLRRRSFSWLSFSPRRGPPSGSLSREPLAGKLPWGFMSRRDPNSALHTRDVDHDYRHSWVQPFHFCEGGGMGLFFYVPRGRQVLPTGSLLGMYSGRSGESLKIKYKEAQKLFRASDYVMDHSPSSYVVDEMETQSAGRPAPMTTLTLSTVTLLTTHSTSEWNSSRMSPCRRIITKPSRTMTHLGKLRVTGPLYACLSLVSFA
jgi:hypothetical protein